MKIPLTKCQTNSKYDYTETIQIFTEMDRLLELELSSLECYNKYKLEAPLNSFSDRLLNDHLYTMYKHKHLETASLMWKLVGFFIWRYEKKLEPRVKNCLESKKLTLNEWLKSVKDNRCGDILCVVYFLSMVTRMHTCIHLKNQKTWCTLKVVPLLHHELMSRCNLHLVYLGFGIFLQLKRCLLPINILQTLGEVTSDKPGVLEQIVVTGIKREHKTPVTGTPPKAK